MIVSRVTPANTAALIRDIAERAGYQMNMTVKDRFVLQPLQR
jgi:hypothetical protein